jgi:hypothetical protein
MTIDQVVKLAQAISPIATVSVAVLGIRAWYWQLTAKRRFEIAEQGMVEWRRANESLTVVRSIFSLANEADETKPPEEASEAQKKIHKEVGHIFTRLQKTSGDFDKITLNKHLCELHLSKKAGQCFDVLLRVRHLVWAAAHMMVVDSDSYLPPEQALEQAERRIEYRFDIYERRVDGKPNPKDKLSRVLDEAWLALEAECRPALQPPTFWQFLFGWMSNAEPKPWSAEAKKVLLIKD